MRRVVLIALAMALSLPASAQNADAPDASADANIWYAASNSASDRAVGWLTTDDTPGSTGTVGGAVPEDCQVPGTEGNGLPSPLCEWDALDWTWTYTLNPALRGPVQLAAGGTIHMRVYLGAGTGTGSGLEVTALLKQGETVIAEGSPMEHAYTASATGTNYGYVAWDVPVSVAQLDASTPIVWTVHVVGTAGEAEDNLFMAVGEPRGRSRIELPIGGGAATTQLPDGPVDVTKVVNASASETFTYGWKGPGSPQRIHFQTTGAGAATLVVRDTSSTLFNHTSTGPEGTLTQRNEAKNVTGTAGNWTITLTLASFNGTVRFTIGAPGAPPPTSTGTSTHAEDAHDDAHDGEQDATTSNAPSNGAPGLPLGAVFVGLAALAVGLRRRV